MDRHTGGPWGTLAQVEPALTACTPKTDEARRTAPAWREAMRRVESMVVVCVRMASRRKTERRGEEIGKGPGR